VKLHALAQRKLPRGVVERLPCRGERRLVFQLRILVQQRVVHVDVHNNADTQEVHMGIHIVLVAIQRQNERVGVCG